MVGRRYKPVARKVRPVPTNMPDLSAQAFKPIPLLTPPLLPTKPPRPDDLPYTVCLSREHLDLMLSTVPDGFLSEAELDLLAFVLVEWQAAITFNDSERGTFNREYFPDYVIPVIEQGKYEQSCAAYRSPQYSRRTEICGSFMTSST